MVDCLYCKYHSSVRGLDACVWKDGLIANRTGCDMYEKSWQKQISFYVFLYGLIFLFIIFPVYLILIGLGVL